jgi:hypothetical protein
MINNGLYWMMLAVSLLSTIAAAGLPKIDPQDCVVRSATASVVGLGLQGTFHFSRKDTEKGITTLVTFEVTGLKDGEEFDYSSELIGIIIIIKCYKCSLIRSPY